MWNVDEVEIEKILSELEEKDQLFPQYTRCKDGEKGILLGVGAFSLVYDMTEKSNPQKHYAMKVIGMGKYRPDSDEVQRTNALQYQLYEQSPHIVRIIDTKEVRYENSKETLCLILMERMEPLLQKDKFKKTSLAREELSKEKEVLRFAMDIGQALLIAHKNCILHRDVKLENIFWDSKQRTYQLGDFGIAKYVENGNAETVVYTDGYGAPEIEKRFGDNYNATADIYSFGITLYLLLNELCFPGSAGYYANQVQYHPDFVFPAPKHASLELVKIIRKMCSYSPEDRYQSMQEVLTQLSRLLDENAEREKEDLTIPVDLETETYRETKKIERQEKNEVEEADTYARRSEFKRSRTGRDFICFFLLFILLLKSMTEERHYVSDWRIWLLPLGLFLEAWFLRLRDLHITVGCIIVGFAVYSAATTTLMPMHILGIVCVISGSGVLVASSAVAEAVFLWLEITERFRALDFLEYGLFQWVLLGVTSIALIKYWMSYYKNGTFSETWEE